MGLFHDCETLNFAKGRSKLYLGGCGCGWVLLAGGVSGNPQYLLFICIVWQLGELGRARDCEYTS